MVKKSGLSLGSLKLCLMEEALVVDGERREEECERSFLSSLLELTSTSRQTTIRASLHSDVHGRVGRCPSNHI